MSAGGIDLVCWDFGDTLVGETFMQLAPDGVPEWPAAYRAAFDADPTFAQSLNLGEASLCDLVDALAYELPNTPRPLITRHLRTVWHRIEWFPEALAWIERLNGHVLQAVVTVNPHEFHGIAVACGLDELVDVIVTSADTVSLSKPVMARRARRLLGLDEALSTTLLIDNKVDNIDEFVTEGGEAVVFDRTTISAELEQSLRQTLSS